MQWKMERQRQKTMEQTLGIGEASMQRSIECNFYRHVKQPCCSKCNLCNLSLAAIPYAPPKLFKMHVIVTIHCAWERGGNSTPLSIKSCKTQTYSLPYVRCTGRCGGLLNFKPCKTPKRWPPTPSCPYLGASHPIPWLHLVLVQSKVNHIFAPTFYWDK